MLSEIEVAYDRIKNYINKTPVMTSRTLNKLVNASVYIKCENFQRAGAFKCRGAFNSLSQLSLEEQKRGVITHSSGNHAQAIALAARELKIKATIVMPKNAPIVKKEATASYGAKIVECGNNPTDRKEKTDELIEEHDYILIHPYNYYPTIYGAGTAAYELINEVGNLDLVLGPVGGGGLISGTSIATKELCQNAEVLAVEPLNANDAYKSFYDGSTIFPSINPNTIADGLRTSLGDITFKIIKEFVDDILTVTEEEILNAMQFYWERMKLVVEPSGAVSLAGLIKYSNLRSNDIQDKRIGVIISGGNIDLTSFFSLLENQIN
ncbi:MAG: pyridoxal-phosphate dependent enzyme [Candidatus Hodarchaeota archaeon]